jgi:hypothetical protein
LSSSKAECRRSGEAAAASIYFLVRSVHEGLSLVSAKRHSANDDERHFTSIVGL